MRAVLFAAALVVGWPLAARADDTTACNAAIVQAERKAAVPTRVLGTIALVESGRAIGNRLVPWPWSINVGGIGQYFATKEAAIEAVRTLYAAGQRSIDVGCMQINLAAHPQAFGSLDTAFDPPTNADYAAHFLQALYQQTGRLASAMTSYHSQTPVFANDYARRLLAVWPGAAKLGLKAEPLPAPAGAPGEGSVKARPSALRTVSLHGAAWPR